METIGNSKNKTKREIGFVGSAAGLQCGIQGSGFTHDRRYTVLGLELRVEGL